MKKIIRLTERDLTRIVKLVIKETEASMETSMSQEKIQKLNLFKKSISSCFSTSKYPNLHKLFTSLGRLQLSVWEFQIALFVAVGITIALVAGGAEGGAVALGISSTALESLIIVSSQITGWAYIGLSNLINDFEYSVNEVAKALQKNPKLYFKEISKLNSCVYEEVASLMDWW